MILELLLMLHQIYHHQLIKAWEIADPVAREVSTPRGGTCTKTNSVEVHMRWVTTPVSTTVSMRMLTRLHTLCPLLFQEMMDLQAGTMMPTEVYDEVAVTTRPDCKTP